jgi:hypothetical protein
MTDVRTYKNHNFCKLSEIYILRDGTLVNKWQVGI